MWISLQFIAEDTNGHKNNILWAYDLVESECGVPAAAY